MPGWIDRLIREGRTGEVPTNTANRLRVADLQELDQPGSALSEDLVAYGVEVHRAVGRAPALWVRPHQSPPHGDLDGHLARAGLPPGTLDGDGAPRLIAFELCHNHYSLLIYDRQAREFTHLDTANRRTNNAQAVALVRTLAEGGYIDDRAALTHADWVPKQRGGSNNCGPMHVLMLAAIAGTDGSPGAVQGAIVGQVSNTLAEQYRGELLAHLEGLFEFDDEDEDDAPPPRVDPPREEPRVDDPPRVEVDDDVAEEIVVDDDLAEEVVAELPPPMPWAPRSLRYDEFLDPRPPLRVDDSSGAREVPRSEFHAEVRSTHRRSRLRLESLRLEREGQRSRAYAYATDTDHDPAPADGRFEVRVGEPAAQTIVWELARTKRLRRGRLELFVAGQAEPVWRRELTARELRTAPDGTVDDTNRRVRGGLAWTGHLDGAHATDDRVRARSGPYKLKLSVFTRAGDLASTREAWTYFDVKYQHRYKLLKYLPTTDFGCFGVNLDPQRGRLGVYIDALLGFLPVLPSVAPWDPGRRDELAARYPQRIRDDWSAKFDLACGGVRVAPVFEVNARAVVDLEAMTGTENPLHRNAALLQRMDDEHLHFCAWFRDGAGGSGVMLHPTGASVNLFIPSALDERQRGMMSGPIAQDDLQRLHQAVLALRDDPLFQGGGARVEVLDPGGREERPRVVIPFAAEATDLDPAADAALARLAEALNAASGGLNEDIPVFVTGRAGADEQRRRQRKQEYDLRRARSVAWALRDVGLHTPSRARPGATASEIAASSGYPLTIRRGEPVEAGRVEVEFGWTDDAEYAAFMQTPTTYNSLVHEFGHMLGIPDEYMTYAFNTPTKRIADSQPRLLTMCRARGLPEPVYPREGANNFNAGLMSAGVRFHERYYLTVAEAVEKATGLPDGAAPRWDIEPHAGAPALGTEDTFDEAFEEYALPDALHAARRAIERHTLDPARIAGDLRAAILHAKADAVIAYVKVVDRDSLAPLARIGPGEVLVGVGVVDGEEVLHASIHARQDVIACSIAFADDVPLRQGFHVLHRDDARVPVTLRATRRFDGVGLFTCSTRRVQVYAAADGGDPIDMRRGAELPGDALGGEDGVVLWLAGDVSLAQLGLTLRSAAQRVSGEAASAQLKEDVPRLDVHALALEQGEPQPLPAAIARGPGGVVLLQDDRAARPRTKITVHRPDDHVGLLVLATESASVRIFADAQPRPGAAAIAPERTSGGVTFSEYVIPNTAFDARGRAVFWLEGATLSAAVGDAAIVLRSAMRGAGGLREYERAALTVIDARLTATVPSTPARTERSVGLVRADAAANTIFVCRSTAPERRRPNTGEQQFDLMQLRARPGTRLQATRPYATTDFADNPPLVLIRGSLADDAPARVELALQPDGLDGRISWDLVRAADEASDEPPPALAGDGLRRSFGADATGSFHVRAQLDGWPMLILNLVLVEATLLPDGEEAPAAGVVVPPLEIDAGSADNTIARAGAPPQPQIVRIRSGDFHEQPCVRLRGQVRLVGGGPDGRRGADRVYAGWVQNLTRVTVRARYGGGGTVALIHAHDKDHASLLRPFQLGFDVGDSYFLPGDPREELEVDVSPDAPILDTGNMGQGGVDSTLGESKFEREALAGGSKLVVTAKDAPATEFFVHFPGAPGRRLSRFRYEHSFRAYLCVWTNCALTGDRVKTQFRDASAVGDRTFTVLRRVDWDLAGRYRVTWDEDTSPEDLAGEAWAAKIHVDPHAGGDALQATIVAVDDTRRRAAEAGVECYYPTELQTFAWRAR